MSIPFIKESIIDEAIQWAAANPEEAAHFWDQCLVAHPALEAYLEQEDFILLTPAEKEYLSFTLTVLLKSLGTVPTMDETSLIYWENFNWADELDKLSLTNRLDFYFAGYPQEDLLAFVEDTVFDPENELLSKEGRLPLFIVIKTVLDCLVLPTTDTKS